MRYKIEKNTVQETLIIPLYARKMCSELYPNLYRDEAARRLVNAVDYDFSALEKKSRNLMQRFGFLEVAMRQNDLAYNDLKGPSVSGFFRFLARVGDGMMNMQIVKIKFRGKQ